MRGDHIIADDQSGRADAGDRDCTDQHAGRAIMSRPARRGLAIVCHLGQAQIVERSTEFEIGDEIRVAFRRFMVMVAETEQSDRQREKRYLNA